MSCNEQQERYEACMVLSGAGNALGHKHRKWKHCKSGRQIHEELENLGGLENVTVKSPDWMVSDDVVMHLETAEALADWGNDFDKKKFYPKLAERYEKCMKDMTRQELGSDKQHSSPVNERPGGHGAAMRAMCIGLRYAKPEELEDLIAVSLESSWMTHRYPTSYLGGLAAALFTAYAIQARPIREWGKGLVDTLSKALQYMESQGRCGKKIEKSWKYFNDKWKKYIGKRQIAEGKMDPVFPEKYGIEERDRTYERWNFSGIEGSSDHDHAPIIAYDAILAAGDNWKELCSRAMFYAGDSDSTGVLAAAWYGAMFGYPGVPVNNYKELMHVDRLKEAGAKLYILSHPPSLNKHMRMDAVGTEEHPEASMYEQKHPEASMYEQKHPEACMDVQKHSEASMDVQKHPEASMNEQKHHELKEHYEASMVLSGAGDALGYKNGEWEFCHSGSIIHDELEQLGGIENVTVKLPQWMVSDDTVMHLATAEALMEWGDDTDKERLYHKLAYHFKNCMKDMEGRAPGVTSKRSCHLLKPDRPQGYCIPFNTRAGGCGAAMRAMCIGLRFPRPEELSNLIAVSVESGRMTHHHPTGYLGSLASALFTTYAIQGRPVQEWGKGLMDELPNALDYVVHQGRYVEENKNAWSYFENAWRKYLHTRGIGDGKSEPVFPDKYGVEERDKTYKSWSFSGWGGSSGHDAPMIAYDALLSAGSNWKELCHRAMFHSGDSDSTGVIAAAWFGAMFGYKGVPKKNYQKLEYVDRLKKAGTELYSLSHPTRP